MNEAVESLLLSKGISPTAMRLLVLEYLLAQSSAVGLPQLEEAFEHSERTTLYRTLKTFEEKGLIHPIQDGSGSTRYALCADPCTEEQHYDLHLHFFCTRCGETYCLPKLQVPEISLPSRFILEEVSLIAKGVCEGCREKECNPIA